MSNGDVKEIVDISSQALEEGKPVEWKGWKKVEVDPAENERIDKRKVLLGPIVEGVLPHRTLEQCQAYSRRNFSYLGEDTDFNAEARAVMQREEEQRDALVSSIARTTVAYTDLKRYTSGISSMAEDLSPTDEGIDPIYVNTLVRAISTVEQAELFQQLAHEWKEKFLTTIDNDTIPKRSDHFLRIIGGLVNRSALPLSKREMHELLASFTHVYEAAYTLPDDKENRDLFEAFQQGAEQIGFTSNDPEQVQRFSKIFDDTSAYKDRAKLTKFIDAVARYGKNHGLTEDAVRGIETKLLPAIESGDPQVAILEQGDNIWGDREGNFGAGDFICHAYSLKVSPSNINELFMVAREIPTTALAKLNQNRLDAKTAGGVFGVLRDFIHDQRPYIHDVIHAMVVFYDTGDRRQLDDIVAKTDYFSSQDKESAKLVDRSRYEKEVDSHSANSKLTTVIDGKERPIDVLRRLDENTQPVDKKPPVTSDPEFNTMLETLVDSANTNKRLVLQRALDYTNDKLMGMMNRGEIGIEPNHIMAYAWLERQAYGLLQGLRYEDQLVAYKQPWFHSILSFNEMTASSQDFDNNEFQQYLSHVSGAGTAQEAYQMIFHRIIGHIGKLTGKYRDEGKGDRVGALWSGNVAHELVGLIDLKPAETAVGKRLRNEASVPEILRSTGD